MHVHALRPGGLTLAAGIPDAMCHAPSSLQCSLCPVSPTLFGPSSHPLPAGRQSRESKAFWKNMMKVHEKLTDAKQISAYNVVKEQKLKVRWWGWFTGGRYAHALRARQ